MARFPARNCGRVLPSNTLTAQPVGWREVDTALHIAHSADEDFCHAPAFVLSLLVWLACCVARSPMLLMPTVAVVL